MRREEMPTIEDRMTPDPVTIRSDQTVGEAFVLMFEHDIRHLPVVEHNKLVGILSDRDIRQFLGKARIGIDDFEKEKLQLRLPVREIMATHVQTVEGTTPIGEGVKRMVDHKIGALPVVDLDKRVVGIFTEFDALHYALYLIERYQGTYPKT
ncbi:MAG: CBS domain-containing protein [Candidatus Manganitrophaceae bacterium]